MILNESEQKIQDALLTFVDFLYALVFGLVLIQLFDQVITANMVTQVKVGKALLVIGVFYFIAWDWMHGRLLTIRNPYTGYRRFFIEILIAASGYGAALSALNSDARFLVYLVMILALGVWWAHVTLQEVPGTEDAEELRFIRIYQSVATIVVFALYHIWLDRLGREFQWWASFILITIGYIFVFIYELRIERTTGLLGGPGVPWLGREVMAKIRQLRFRRGG